MDIYLAARYGRRQELADYRRYLEGLGHTVTSRWVLGLHEGQVYDNGIRLPGTPDESQQFAIEDMADLQAADTVIAFTEPPRSAASRGGRHVELGLAIAWGKRVCICGPLENVFCCLPGIEHYDTPTTLFAAFQSVEVQP